MPSPAAAASAASNTQVAAAAAAAIIPDKAAAAAVDPNDAAAVEAASAAEKAAPLTLDDEKPPVVPDADTNILYEYNPTGDAGLDVALGFVGQLGFGPDHPAIKAATTGDFSKIEDALTKLGDKAKGFQRYLGAAKESYTRRADQRKAVETATQKAVVDAVGGVANWNAIQKWAAANADEGEKASINASFAAGGFAAVAAAKELLTLWKASGQSAAKPKAVLKDGAASEPGSSTGPLSPREYIDAFKDLQRKLGQKAQASSEHQALIARRRAYRG